MNILLQCCKIYKGQRVVKKLSDRETAQFIRTTAVPPATRKKQICNIHRTNDFTQDPMLKNLQFSIAERPLHMEGRILPAPELLMDAPVQPREGVWDARRRLFYRGADINTWVVMNYNPRFVDQRSTETFITKLLHMADEKGMKFSEPVAAFGVRTPCPEQDFTRLKQEYSNLQLVLVILGRGGDLYARIKRTGDTEVGILSQCVQATNVTAIKPQTLGNILLKINAKMGGINNVLSRTGMPMILERPVMIMGADVNHPSAGDGESPSMAAVVASYDRFASKFSVEVRPQPHRVEIIQDLKEMTKNLLRSFFIYTKGHKPERIVMYRDGVSESQFQEVLSYELKAMRTACTETEVDYTPGITFLVVQKRHHTRYINVTDVHFLSIFFQFLLILLLSSSPLIGSLASWAIGHVCVTHCWQVLGMHWLLNVSHPAPVLVWSMCVYTHTYIQYRLSKLLSLERMAPCPGHKNGGNFKTTHRDFWVHPGCHPQIIEDCEIKISEFSRRTVYSGLSVNERFG
ncbi:argonaute 2-like 6 [Homarus americanus]|uniref:Argonaute 2-like 6 n=3 Tax=Homarus americanus TaxID=6706 RepID=A0A8J5N3Q7_HOMAM|nr:argonaute 2-like 6 [Homarus americanus]